MSMETLQELAVKIFYEEDKASKASVADGIKALAGFALGSQVTTFLKDIAFEAIHAGAEIDDFSNRLGVGAEELQAFQYAAALSGASSEQAANGLRVLEAQMEAASSGSKEAAANFAELGVSLKDSNGKTKGALDIIHEVADGFTKIDSASEKTAKAMKLFGRAGVSLIPLLSEGSDGMAELYAEAERLGVIVSKDTIKTLAEADDKFDALSQQVRGLKLNIGAGLAPIFVKVANVLQEKVIPFITRLTRETNLVQYAMGLLAGGGFAALLGGGIKAAKFFGVLKEGTNTVWGLVKAFGGLGLYVGMFALLALAIEDVYTWLQGGDSLIGPFLEKFLGVKEAATLAWDLKEAFKGVGQTFTDLKPTISFLVDAFLQFVVSLLPAFAKALEFVLNLVASVVSALTGVAGILGGIASGKSMDQIGAIADKAWEGIAKGGLGAGKVLLEAVNGKGAVLPAPPPAAPGAAAIGPGIDQKNNITINVADASGVGSAVQGAIGNANQAAFAAAGG